MGMFTPNELIGIGGLNLDSYTPDDGVGRMRRLYIRKSHHRKGYATKLVQQIITGARQHFSLLRLFTDNETASQFYETLGFQKATGFKVSHQLRLNTSTHTNVVWGGVH